MIAAYSAIDRFAEAFRAGGIPADTAARMLARWASSAKVNEDDWSEAMMPTWIAVEIDCGASEQDVIASVDKCLAHFAAARRAE